MCKWQNPAEDIFVLYQCWHNFHPFSPHPSIAAGSRVFLGGFFTYRVHWSLYRHASLWQMVLSQFRLYGWLAGVHPPLWCSIFLCLRSNNHISAKWYILIWLRSELNELAMEKSSIQSGDSIRVYPHVEERCRLLNFDMVPVVQTTPELLGSVSISHQTVESSQVLSALFGHSKDYAAQTYLCGRKSERTTFRNVNICGSREIQRLSNMAASHEYKVASCPHDDNLDIFGWLFANSAITNGCV